ncbi:MAG: hypothetical protein DELT_01772 [Desulfovibrio sp.]
MKAYIRFALLLVCVAAVAACSPARTGVIGQSLTTNLKPGMAITANAPLTFVSGGRVWASLKGDDIAPISSASFDYALFADPAVSPAQKFAYAAFVRIDERENWMFQPQGHGLPGQFGAVKPVLPPQCEGRMYTLHVPSQGDWASDVLTENGQTPPEVWLVKRWVFSLDSDLRAMAEYREPWPEFLEAPTSEIMLLRDTNAEYLRDFERRALAAFSFDATLGDFSTVPQTAAAWKMPRTTPDLSRLVGDVLRLTQGDDAANFN